MAKTSTARHLCSHLGYCLLYWLCFICQTLSLLKGDRSFHWHWVESFQNTGWPGHLMTTTMNIKYNYIISWVVFIPHSATLLWLLFTSSFANIPTFSNICHFLCDDEVATADHLPYDTNTNTQIHLQKHNYTSTLHKYWYKNRFS